MSSPSKARIPVSFYPGKSRWSDEPEPPPQATGWVEVEGGRLWYEDTGGTGEPIVLLHASTGSAAMLTLLHLASEQPSSQGRDLLAATRPQCLPSSQGLRPAVKCPGASPYGGRTPRPHSQSGLRPVRNP